MGKTYNTKAMRKVREMVGLTPERAAELTRFLPWDTPENTADKINGNWFFAGGEK